MRIVILGVALLLCLLSPAALARGDAPLLANGGFDAAASKAEPIPGWTLQIGARNGGTSPLSVAELDRKEKHGGKASLHLAGGAQVLAYQSVTQDVEARPGGSYELSAFTRTKNVRHEQNALGIPQFDNSYLGLFLYDGLGEVVGRQLAPLERPSTDGWKPLRVALQAPQTTRRATVILFLSVSGDAWFDDLSLEIRGGEAVPEPATVFAEDFEALKELPPAWLLEIGATNGAESPTSLVEVSTREGAGRSKRSLHLAGGPGTLAWRTVNRWFDAAPGDSFEFRAQVKSEKVHQEKTKTGVDQFANFHMNLSFVDASGEMLGAARFANPDPAAEGWQAVSLRAVAPEGAVRVQAGLFLSMSGDAWFDDVTLTRQGGGTPAYAGWQELATAHLRLRYPKDHPRAADMAAYGAAIEEALARVASALGTKAGEPITMFLYRDGEQGRALTGRDLDYAEPERRAVHQRPDSTLTHELTHVVALRELGYAQTGLLGEGLAVWLDGAPAEQHHATAAALLRDGRLPPMDGLLKDFRSQPSAYPAAGSFCGWLLETHGLPAFRRFYPLSDPAAAAPAVLKQDWAAVDAAWRAFLGSLEGGNAQPADGKPPAADGDG
jgi:hypothetical protein